MMPKAEVIIPFISVLPVIKDSTSNELKVKNQKFEKKNLP